MKARHFIKNFLALLGLLFIFAPTISAQGHFEFGLHYSGWSVNILKPIVEKMSGESLQDYILKEVHRDYPEIEESDYSQKINLDSSGKNFGTEVRWYPAGQHGVFSLGISIEKTSMQVNFTQLSSQIELSDGSIYNGNFEGDVSINPLSLHLSFRWDTIPSWKIRPYITLGFGIAKGIDLRNAEFKYNFEATLKIDGELFEHYELSDTKTFENLIDELKKIDENIFSPGFFPFIQLNIGLKGEISKNIFLLADAGIWNGFLFRGGIAIRI